MNNLTWSEFERVDMRVGTILEVKDFPEARNPAYKLSIDLIINKYNKFNN